MNQETQFSALILIKAAQQLINHRRITEQACGYPASYGGDELLLTRMNEFLAEKTTQHELIEALEFVKNKM